MVSLTSIFGKDRAASHYIVAEIPDQVVVRTIFDSRGAIEAGQNAAGRRSDHHSWRASARPSLRMRG